MRGKLIGRTVARAMAAATVVAAVAGTAVTPASAGMITLPVVTAGTITEIDPGLPAGATAALVNIAMTDGTAPGYITADRCDALTAGPQARSNGNHLAGTAVANLAVVPLDDHGHFCIYNQSLVNLVVDVQGAFSDDPSGATFTVVTPRRALDTRSPGATTPAAGSVTVVHTGATPGTTAVLANITMTGAHAPGYITADRCTTLGNAPHTFSTGNHLTTTAIANLAVVPLDPDGTFCIYNQSPVDLAVDIQGTFTTTSDGDGDEGGRFLAVPPRRILDTRPPPIPGPPTTSCSSVIHIGDSTSVGLISPSIIKNPADRVDAQYRRVGVSQPIMEISGARSIVERLRGQLNAFEVATSWKQRGYESCWVLALGTTDTANVGAGSSVSRRARIDKMMNLIGDDPVLWVNVKTLESSGDWSNGNMQLWNQELAAAALRYPNLHVYDWSSVAQGSWFSSDRVHYTPEGYRIRARMIADALAAQLPG